MEPRRLSLVGSSLAFPHRSTLAQISTGNNVLCIRKRILMEFNACCYREFVDLYYHHNHYHVTKINDIISSTPTIVIIIVVISVQSQLSRHQDQCHHLTNPNYHHHYCPHQGTIIKVIKSTIIAMNIVIIIMIIISSTIINLQTYSSLSSLLSST